MGITLSVFVEDESIESPYISRRFYNEIIQDSYVPFPLFLTEEDIKVITPNPDGEIIIGQKPSNNSWKKDKETVLKQLLEIINGKGSLKNIDNILDKYVIKSEKLEDRERDPEHLLSALKKVEDYLIQNAEKLPLVHEVYATPELTEIVGYTLINGVKAFFEGDLFYYENYNLIRNKIHVRSYWEDTGKIDFYLDVKKAVTINGQTFFIHSTTKAEQFKSEFENIYTFLKEAIKQHKKVLWEFG